MKPVMILDKENNVLRNKVIPLVNDLWKSHNKKKEKKNRRHLKCVGDMKARYHELILICYQNFVRMEGYDIQDPHVILIFEAKIL